VPVVEVDDCGLSLAQRLELAISMLGQELVAVKIAAAQQRIDGSQGAAAEADANADA